MFRTRVCAADGILVFVVVALAGLLLALPFLQSGSGASLIVSTPDGSEAYPLSENRRIAVSSGGISLTVEILDGRARVIESDCPDGVCVASGWIDRPGQSVVCAPAGVRLLIAGEEKGGSEVDFVAG